MNYQARPESLNSETAVRRFRWSRLRGVCCMTLASAALLTAGCASESSATFPPAWRSVRLGMQRDQVAAIAGAPAQANPSGTEEIYYKSVQRAHWELHVRYDAGGTVVQRWWIYIR